MRSTAAALAALAIVATACNSQTTASSTAESTYCSESRRLAAKHGDLILKTGQEIASSLVESAGVIDLSNPEGSFDRARRALARAADNVIARIQIVVRDLRGLRELAPGEIRSDLRLVQTSFQKTLANFRRYRKRLDSVTEANEQQIAAEGDRAAAPLETEAFNRAALALGEYEGSSCNGKGLFVVVEARGGSGTGSSGASGGGSGGAVETPVEPAAPTEPAEPTEPREPEQPASPSQPVYPY